MRTELLRATKSKVRTEPFESCEERRRGQAGRKKDELAGNGDELAGG